MLTSPCCRHRHGTPLWDTPGASGVARTPDGGEARARRLAGQPQQAVEYTLDAATFGADLVRSSLLIHAMIGGAMVAMTKCKSLNC